MTHSLRARSLDGQHPPRRDADSERQRLVDHLAVLVVREHRRRQPVPPLPDQSTAAPGASDVAETVRCYNVALPGFLAADGRA